MIEKIIEFSAKNKFLILILTAVGIFIPTAIQVIDLYEITYIISA